MYALQTYPFSFNLTQFDRFGRPETLDALTFVIAKFLSEASLKTDHYFSCMFQDSFQYAIIEIVSIKSKGLTRESLHSTTCLYDDPSLTPEYLLTTTKVDGFYKDSMPKEYRTIIEDRFNIEHKFWTYKRTYDPRFYIDVCLPTKVNPYLEQTIHYLVSDTFNRLDKLDKLPSPLKRSDSI